MELSLPSSAPSSHLISGIFVLFRLSGTEINRAWVGWECLTYSRKYPTSILSLFPCGFSEYIRFHYSYLPLKFRDWENGIDFSMPKAKCKQIRDRGVRRTLRRCFMYHISCCKEAYTRICFNHHLIPNTGKSERYFHLLLV